MSVAMVAWVGSAAVYLLFAGQASPHELIAGLGASVLVAAFAIIAHRAAAAPMRLRLPWLRVIGGVAKDLVVDTVRVGAALLRPRPGTLSRVGAPTEPGRRAVAILAASVAPNSFVVRAGDDGMVLHRLVGSDE
jgi:multisubunit Na+/H+ antiporter MnhE subunit